MALKTHRIIYLIMRCSFYALLVIHSLLKVIPNIFLLISFVLFVLSFLYKDKYCRCPHCSYVFNEYVFLSSNLLVPKYCPHCGGRLQ